VEELVEEVVVVVVVVGPLAALGTILHRQ